jgi:hypothetical protein
MFVLIGRFVSKGQWVELQKNNTAVYEPRNPWTSDYYRCIEAHFEDLRQVWDDRYSKRYGYFRSYILDVIYKYLDCGDLHCGFARVKCKDCGHEFILAFSCKRRHFCPSCHQKRVIEFGEHICKNVLKYVPHRHWVFSIPKILRIYFMYDRKLLAKLSICAWKVLSKYLKQTVNNSDGVPGAIIAMQTFGAFQEFHPHAHILVSDGCFNDDNSFEVGLTPKSEELEELFRYEVFKMLKAEGKINDTLIENMMNWHHSGFNIYCGDTIWPHNEEGLERLARYIIRASFSQENLKYIPFHESSDGTANVLYTSKDGKTQKTFDAIDWLAQLTTHIPNKNEQMVRYYGYYSNASRCKLKKEERDDDVQGIIQSDISSKSSRQNWARLIQKIYNVDPLICPKCQGNMRIISFIEDHDLITVILKHLNLWETRNHDPPVKDIKHTPELIYDDSYSQVPEVDYWDQ